MSIVKKMESERLCTIRVYLGYSDGVA